VIPVEDMDYAALLSLEEFLYGCLQQVRALPPCPYNLAVEERFQERWMEASDELARRQALAAWLAPYARDG
jgi:hypothetical protein